MKYLMVVSSLASVVMVGALATPAKADECDKLTFFTFSAPVALPGVILPPGTYRFTHPDCAMSNDVLRVSSRDGLNVYATLLTIPEERPTPGNQPEVILAERPAGSPEAIVSWFHPEDTVGDELIYPKRDGRRR